ncbi:MAG: hypothetical protein DRN78_06075 [Thermoproteota archaeon]|nr:MAG: hypothetical protein DRN78_06075 [Candidatus Korarchaeota archaeon]
MSKTRTKPKIHVRYEGVIDEELTQGDIDSIKRGLIDVLMGRTIPMDELIKELIKEGKLSANY